MRIISHRGFWKTPSEKNKEIAFLNSVNAGFGMETDLRDSSGEIVMSHDMPVGGEINFEDFCTIPGIKECLLALNIKSDGLAKIVKKLAIKHELKDWFVFDMSIPDMIAHIKVGNPIFTRLSDVEPTPSLLQHSVGIWLDAFYSEWFSTKDILEYLRMDKKVCVVSPELHGRIPDTVWEKLYTIRDHEQLILCTDFPDKAEVYFK